MISHEKKNLVIGLFAVCAVLVLVLVFLALSTLESSGEVKKFSVQDECALMMGNLIRQIVDEGSCKTRCNNECDVRNMEFEDSKFVAQNNSCHVCDCYCV